MTSTQKKLKLKPGIIIPDRSFSLNGEKWQTCRETFANDFRSEIEGFFVSTCNRLPVQNVFDFMKKTEKILELEKIKKEGFLFGDYSIFYKTNLPFIGYIKPAEFWMNHVLKRSLLTIFVRCGDKYNLQKDNYEEALLSESYVTKTKTAVYRFLFGFHDIKYYDRNGWVSNFVNCSNEQIVKDLNNHNKTMKSLIGVGTIWS